MNNKRKICVVTGSRAEYGLLYWLIKYMSEDSTIELQLIVTGMHLSPEFGLTYKVIENDGFKINKKVECLLSADTKTAISKSVALGLIGFSDAFNELNPDIIVLLGDRFEIFAAAQAAMIAQKYIAHLYGGEISEGAFDDCIRHSITKMSDFHFVANEVYQKRVLQLGESKDRVFNVGTSGLDNIHKLKLLNKEEFQKEFGAKFSKINFLVTYHSTTLNSEIENIQGINELLKALDKFTDANIIFTKSNADTFGRIINEKFESFVGKNKNKRFVYTSLGQVGYLSALKEVNVVIGNSSSGLTEAPAFKIPTVNVGSRQNGRLKSNSVIDCQENTQSIINAINKALSHDFIDVIKNSVPPYGVGGDVSQNILNILKSIQLDKISKIKKFNDLI